MLSVRAAPARHCRERERPAVSDRRAGCSFQPVAFRRMGSPVVSDHPVGVDIQQCRSFKPNIADRFFHPDEVQYLSSLTCRARKRVLHAVGAHESYVKADGRGLRLLRQFCVDIACQPPAITVGAPGPPVCAEFPRSRLQARRMRAEKKNEIAHSNRFTAAFHPIKRKKEPIPYRFFLVYSDSFRLANRCRQLIRAACAASVA